VSRVPNRRRALQIMGAGFALPLGAFALGAWRHEAPAPVQWNGEVLGAISSMTLWHANPRVAERAIARMRVEIERLENIFSLYRADSEITRLNTEGRLAAPSADLLVLLEQSRRIAELSNGAFDPTIQPLWWLHSTSGTGRSPDRAALDRALALVDYRNLTAHAGQIRFGRSGMAASLNGIAQGYVTDRITEILGNEGFESAMIELGETRALGTAPGGQPFAVGLIDPLAPASVGRSVSLADRALAVSGGYGTVLADGAHHIFDPHTGESAQGLVQVAVLAGKAAWADALSTAIYVAGETSAPGLLAAYPGSNAILSRNDGSTLEL
jgi:thiamine biosynthesis lipoprotein